MGKTSLKVRFWTKYDIKLIQLFSVIDYTVFLAKGYVWKFLKKYIFLALKFS